MVSPSFPEFREEVDRLDLLVDGLSEKMDEATPEEKIAISETVSSSMAKVREMAKELAPNNDKNRDFIVLRKEGKRLYDIADQIFKNSRISIVEPEFKRSESPEPRMSESFTEEDEAVEDETMAEEDEPDSGISSMRASPASIEISSRDSSPREPRSAATEERVFEGIVEEPSTPFSLQESPEESRGASPVASVLTEEVNISDEAELAPQEAIQEYIVEEPSSPRESPVANRIDREYSSLRTAVLNSYKAVKEIARSPEGVTIEENLKNADTQFSELINTKREISELQAQVKSNQIPVKDDWNFEQSLIKIDEAFEILKDMQYFEGKQYEKIKEQLTSASYFLQDDTRNRIQNLLMPKLEILRNPSDLNNPFNELYERARELLEPHAGMEDLD